MIEELELGIGRAVMAICIVLAAIVIVLIAFVGGVFGLSAAGICAAIFAHVAPHKLKRLRAR